MCPPLGPPAVNQALLCTALGLPPSFFRRFSQSNASFTVLDFEVERSSSTGSSSSGNATGGGSSAAGGGSAGGLRVRVERVNQVRVRRALEALLTAGLMLPTVAWPFTAHSFMSAACVRSFQPSHCGSISREGFHAVPLHPLPAGQASAQPSAC